MSLEQLAERLGALAVRDAPLGARTTYRVGGRAALLCEVGTRDELALVAEALASSPDVAVLVVGRGSNLLVADRGFDGLALVLSGDFETIDAPLQLDGEVHVRAGGAVALPVLARRCTELGLVGLEWAVGVPGSVGGAVRMNAGGHGSDTAASLVTAEVWDLAGGAASVLDVAALAFGYRRSALRPRCVVLAATFRVAEGDAAASRNELAEIVRWRREHQPGGANCGSVFTNPDGDHAARLVEAAGAKGLRHGTASVSEKHANFIQADRGGSADDVAALIREVRDLVERDSGVALATEVVFVGFGDPT